jgi:peptidoglycan/LPS O-acetylase OafA/YrhL
MLVKENAIGKEEPFTNKHRLVVLDGFRGLAILLVMGYHYFSFMPVGWVGVDLFFVLSGFLITGKLTIALGNPNYFSGFYIRRLLRILPLYYFILIFFFLLVPFLFPGMVTSSYQTLIKNQSYYWTFTANWFIAKNGWPDNTILGPFWSLSCEMQFYLIWPLVLLILFRKREWILYSLSGIVIFAIGFRLIAYPGTVFNYIMLPARIDAFAMGALLYFIIRNGYSPWLRKWVWGIMLVCLLMVLWFMFHFRIFWALYGFYESTIGYTLNAVFWACFMGGILQMKGWGQQIFKSKLLVSLGKYSYGIYLLHMPVKVLLFKWLERNFGIPPGNYQGVILIGVAIILSFLSYQLLEKKFLVLKSKLP